MTALAHIRPRSSARGLKVFVAVVCLVILSLEGWRDWSERDQEFVRIEAEMKNLAKSLVQHTEDIFNLADSILIDVVDRIEESGSTPEAVTGLEGFFTDRIQTLQSVKSLTVYGEDGYVLGSSLSGHRHKVNAREQGFFQHHATSPEKGWFFGSLIQDPLGSEWILTISRRFNKPDGGFGGVVQISIPPRYFANFFGRFDVGSQGTMALFDANGTLLSRYPYIERSIGTKQSAHEWLQSNKISGFGKYTSPVDAVPRFAAYQRNHVFPVVVFSAVGQEEALANWNQEFLFRLAGVTVLDLLIGALGWILAGELRRREAAEAELAILASTDGLTSLANRRAFDRQLDEQWLRAAKEGKPLSLLLVDVDQFKAYNDIYGHQAGDECLKAVAQTLSNAARDPGNLVARYGGEELVVLLPGMDDVGATVVAERIRTQIEGLGLRHEANPPARILTVSIGSASRIPDPNQSDIGPKDLISLADAALYQAKQAGRNRVSSAKAA